MEEIGEDHGRHVLAHILAQYHAQLAALWLKSFAMATQKGFGLSLQFTNMSLQNCWRNWWSMAIPIQNMLPFKSNWRYFCTHAWRACQSGTSVSVSSVLTVQFPSTHPILFCVLLTVPWADTSRRCWSYFLHLASTQNMFNYHMQTSWSTLLFETIQNITLFVKMP